LVPILADRHRKHSHKRIVGTIEVIGGRLSQLSRRQPALPIQVNLVSKELNAQDYEHDYEDAHQHHKSDYVFKGRHDLVQNLNEGFPSAR